MDFDTVMSIISVVVAPLLGAVSFLLWQKLTATDDRLQRAYNEVNKLWDTVDKIKYNYIDRFDEIKEAINKLELKVVEKISILETIMTNHVHAKD